MKESGVYTIYPYSDWFVGLSHYQQHNIGINVYRGLRNVYTFNKEKLIQYFMALSQWEDIATVFLSWRLSKHIGIVLYSPAA